MAEKLAHLINKCLLSIVVLSSSGLAMNGQDLTIAPPEAFKVLEANEPEGPRITPYLQYQTDMAWREDEARQGKFRAVQNERQLQQLQRELRTKLLTMIGGLPSEKTPLRARLTGTIQMDGFRIEKLIYESLPGFQVTALLYVPDLTTGAKAPAVLVPCGHSANGKVHYQALCQRLAKRGYVVLCWDPVGQGERSQFWDEAKGASRYNLICAEHAVLGNLAYLAGANLARWEIWDGIRAVDYLLTRPEVDRTRISITGTSGGGFQTTLIAALDERIKVAAPSCYITSLPMRMANRIFLDPDSDPEQDLSGMLANDLNHAGLLVLLYPRPIILCAAVLDFFPIEGTRQAYREVAHLYQKFNRADRLSMVEGYHEHQFSPENQEAALNFLDRFNGMTIRRGLPSIKELDAKTLQCTTHGQVLLDDREGKNLTEIIRAYYLEHRNSTPRTSIKEMYYGPRYPGIKSWPVIPYQNAPVNNSIAWEKVGSTTLGKTKVDRYLLHHSTRLVIPLLHLHQANETNRRTLLWFDANGKATPENWPEMQSFIAQGYDILTFDFRGLGETRMPYKAVSPDDPLLAKLDFHHAYTSPLSGVLADYVYNSLLIGRPYMLQMIEDAEIVMKFSHHQLKSQELYITGDKEAFTLAHHIAATLPALKLIPNKDAELIKWSEIVEQKRETWPIEYLLPGGAYLRP